ncbi:hypothetical protein PR202_ga14610 [Eleusine coracana subsp. coracana]|uniref:Uncharacterized protein n=1 Tax=Eleusine coracana subsp. coracana TaxID=191504 RepID=A0AAV5CH54_ELECO|nr:hypothetical protein PR202_ga14610 [Eleusine coracana subsp. coracana]
MSEERPVPRRESPWGLPEGDKRQPKAHRCNDRAEDVVQACFEGNPFKTVPGMLFFTHHLCTDMIEDPVGSADTMWNNEVQLMWK